VRKLSRIAGVFEVGDIVQYESSSIKSSVKSSVKHANNVHTFDDFI
jgi:hypothetical protein